MDNGLSYGTGGAGQAGCPTTRNARRGSTVLSRTCACSSWGRSSPGRSRADGSPTSVPRSSRSSCPPRATRCAAGAVPSKGVNRSGISSSRVASAPWRRTSTIPADQALVRRLALESDILIENFRPGRLEAWGLDPSELLADNPRLIVVRISGLRADRAAARPARLRHHRRGGRRPALHHRRARMGRPPAWASAWATRSPRCTRSSVPSSRSTSDERRAEGRSWTWRSPRRSSRMLEGILPEYGYFGVVRERTGNIAHNSAPTNAYPCADGAAVCIAANTTSLAADAVPGHRARRPRGRSRAGHRPGPGAARRGARRGHRLVDADADRRRRGGRTAEPPHPGEPHQQHRRHRRPIRSSGPRHDRRAVDDPRLARPLLVPGIAPKLSRTPGRVPPLAPALGADTEAVRRAWRRSAHDRRPRAPAAPPSRRRSASDRVWRPPAADGRDRRPPGRVQTYLGRGAPGDLGLTLIHEHIFVRDPELERNLPGLEWRPRTAVERAVRRPHDAARAGRPDGRRPHRAGSRPRRRARRPGGGARPRQPRRLDRLVPRADAAALLPGARPGPARRWTRPAGRAVRPRHRGRASPARTSGPGMIKVMSAEAGLTEDVARVMAAAAVAHQHTGVPITTHSHPGPPQRPRPAGLPGRGGVPPTRIIIGHSGDTDDLDYLRALMDAGSTIGMDRFGMEHVLSRRASHATRWSPWSRLGYADRMVLSHDAAVLQPRHASVLARGCTPRAGTWSTSPRRSCPCCATGACRRPSSSDAGGESRAGCSTPAGLRLKEDAR